MLVARFSVLLDSRTSQLQPDGMTSTNPLGVIQELGTCHLETLLDDPETNCGTFKSYICVEDITALV